VVLRPALPGKKTSSVYARREGTTGCAIELEMLFLDAQRTSSVPVRADSIAYGQGAHNRFMR
jgi:hypothetical protein